MVFRITSELGENGTRLHVDGDLSRECLPELGRVCAETKRPLTIDLSGLTSADRFMVEALRQMVREGVKLEGASLYLSLRLSERDEVN